MPRKNRTYRKIIEADLEILPLMNLFVVLIPMLLISAMFIQLAVINMDGPDSAELPDDREELEEGLDLAVQIEDARYVVVGRHLDPVVIDRDPEGMAGDASEELGAALQAISVEHPDTKNIRIVSQPHTLYEDIILVMDVSRGAGLPEIALQAAD